MLDSINKVVLAYSGGLDTSVILKWLQEVYSCEVVTFTADIGQGEEVEPARAKAEALGVKEIYIEDLREEFVRDYVFPMFRANTIYEGEYLLGTSIARPLIAKRLVEIPMRLVPMPSPMGPPVKATTRSVLSWVPMHSGPISTS
jgi:argininosuccinate synthase